jgi:hypothetical protein
MASKRKTLRKRRRIRRKWLRHQLTSKKRWRVG